MKSDVLICDYAWPYNKLKANATAEENSAVGFIDYQTMPINEGIALAPYIHSVTHKNTAVYMWCTWPFLTECIKICNSWGMEYITCAFIWIKHYKDGSPVFGMGRHTAGNTEPCLLFRYKGGRLPFRAKLHSQIVANGITYPLTSLEGFSTNVFDLGTIEVYSEIYGHSKKPEVVQDILEVMYPSSNYLELFATRKRDNWYCYGNKVTGNDLRVDLREYAKL